MEVLDFETGKEKVATHDLHSTYNSNSYNEKAKNCSQHCTNVFNDVHVCLKLRNSVDHDGEVEKVVNGQLDDDDQTYVYTCGGCAQGYQTICELHEHLLSHGMGGSYHYNNQIRTAFPKYDSTCRETQTLGDTEDLPDQFSKIKRKRKCRDRNVNTWATKSKPRRKIVPLKDTAKATKRHAKKGKPLKEKVKHEGLEKDSEIKEERIDIKKEMANHVANNEKTSDRDFFKSSLIEVVASPSVQGIILPDRLAIADENDNDIDEDVASDSEDNVTDEWFPDAEDCIAPEFENKVELNVKKKKISNEVKKKKCQDINVSSIKKSEQSFLCEECKQTFNTERKLKKHIQADHKDMYPYVCNFCRKKVFKTLLDYEEHMKLHPKTLYTCELCGKVLKSREGMRNHQLLHSGLKPHQCNICDYRCRTPAQLKLHLLHHSDEKPEQCDICGKAFYTKPKLSDHLKYCRKDKQHKCPHCPKGFPTGSGLRKHILVHTGEKPWICEICGFATNKPTSLKYHMRTHTGEKPYKCDQCDARLATRSTLVSHIRTHTNEKPFVCSFCGKAFSAKWNLKTHVRQHTGETPYKCGICGMGFKQNVLKKTHMRSHFETNDVDMSKGRRWGEYKEMTEVDHVALAGNVQYEAAGRAKHQFEGSFLNSGHSESYQVA